jgi:hypothetical protein
VAVESQPAVFVTVSTKAVGVEIFAVESRAVESAKIVAGLLLLQMYVVPGKTSLPVPSRVTTVGTPMQINGGVTLAWAAGLGVERTTVEAFVKQEVVGSVTRRTIVSVSHMFAGDTMFPGEVIGLPIELVHR